MAYNRWLAHHGIKDQKWGVKNGPPYPLDRSVSDGHRLIKPNGSPQSKKRKPTPPNTTYVKNHKGPMYFISEKELDGQTLEPRVVDNYFTKNGYEDNQTKRVSFAPDVGKCLSGLSQNVKGKRFNVYVPDVEDGIDVYKPNSKAVPDAEITQEMWVTDPVKVKKLGSITCTGDTGEEGHKFKYGNNEAELYDWNYKWDQKTVFVSGSSKTQDEASGYYRKDLPKDIQKQLDEHMRKGNRIIVGDAPGIDRQVQDYLNAKKYKNVEIYGPGKQVRYSANSKWKTNPIDDPDHEPGSKEWLAKKDIAMTEAADEGLAIVLDEGAKATRKNVQRLSDSGKGVKVYSLNRDGSDSWEDDWDRKWNTSYASKDVKKANDIYKTLSKQEKYFLTAEENSKRYVSREEYGKKGTNVYSVIEQYKDTPVSVIDIWKNDRGGADVSIAVRNDNNYRHKGYASRALENGLKYFYDHPEIEYLVWGVNSQNSPSIELAKKYGFYLYDKRDDGWDTYTLDQKKEVKHAMSYNRWLESDHLEHHGVKGQEWGKRNGPPYPLDRSVSNGSKLLKGSGSPQGKKKYKTSDKTAHKRAERKARTVKEENPEKTVKLSSAKNEDKWELDFLEYVQNEDWADSTSPRHDKKRMLKEYSEYLDDREAYSQKGLAEDVRTAFKKDFANGDPTKYISDIARFPKAGNKYFKTEEDALQQRREQRRFEEFLKNVPLSKRYKELQKEAKNIWDGVPGEYDIMEKGADPKPYQEALRKSEKVHNMLIDEACKMVGADPSKLSSYEKSYLYEGIDKAQYEKSNPQVAPKPQKKSISNRINSLMDRVFGNSIKAQEKGQKKIDVNFEPVTSEKAKTKRGETYEINDWNGDAQDTIKAFKSNPEPHINIARKAAINEARRIFGWYAKDIPAFKRMQQMSDKEISDRFGLDFVSAYSHGTVEFDFGDLGTGDFVGHEVTVEYDLNRRKVVNVSVNG